jgi:hypothetical protein
MSEKQPSRQLTEEEWIVLLDVYQTHKAERMSPQHPAIVAASETLRALGQRAARRTLEPGFRPPSGIYRQLEVFRRLESPRQRVNLKVPQLAEEVWRRFSSDPESCRETADAVRAKAQASRPG